ncbi:ExbD/TolR family protein [Luteibaculum oceani]|uniref:Biopolymer transporter ExbD n=1 Tax=Luteibaculum oceani TaxID=1294296 RepID=A0A5C6UZG4_9FLAO|nr:biopolymer transporter ExbD [Luteibaculum oceani]TXC78782.1 biopolymer transporter ExbD [Luteibaculum oceani]
MNLGSRNKINTGFSMSSMTDLVFLLLIFFIILSTLVSPYALPVDLPSSKNKTKQKPKISVTITKDLEYFIGGKRVSKDNFEAELVNSLVPGEEQQSVVLHVDKAVPTGNMVSVLDVAKRNNCKIVLATQP